VPNFPHQTPFGMKEVSGVGVGARWCEGERLGLGVGAPGPSPSWAAHSGLLSYRYLCAPEEDCRDKDFPRGKGEEGDPEIKLGPAPKGCAKIEQPSKIGISTNPGRGQKCQTKRPCPLPLRSP
jgi:hypothetical protein